MLAGENTGEFGEFIGNSPNSPVFSPANMFGTYHLGRASLRRLKIDIRLCTSTPPYEWKYWQGTNFGDWQFLHIANI